MPQCYVIFKLRIKAYQCKAEIRGSEINPFGNFGGAIEKRSQIQHHWIAEIKVLSIILSSFTFPPLFPFLEFYYISRGCLYGNRRRTMKMKWAGSK